MYSLPALASTHAWNDQEGLPQDRVRVLGLHETVVIARFQSFLPLLRNAALPPGQQNIVIGEIPFEKYPKVVCQRQGFQAYPIEQKLS